MKIVVPTCDAHVYVVPLFLDAWFKAWPGCALTIEVLAGTINPSVRHHRDQVKVAHLGLDEGWSANMLNYLDQTDDDPFMLMLEDYLLTSVNLRLLRGAFELISRHDVGQVRLVPIPGPTVPFSKHFGEFDKSEPYAISLQASLWRPQVFVDLLDGTETPWQVENLASRRARQYNKYMFMGSYEHVVEYQNYLNRGEPRESAVEWVRANL